MNIKKFNDLSKKPTILWLHGLDGSLPIKEKKILNDIGVSYIGIEVNYRFTNIWNIISNMEVDGIIGHSLGGYLAYYLSNYKKIPCLMFMPCFDKEMFKIQELPIEIINNLPSYKNKISVIGNMDDDINKKKQNLMISNTKVYTEDCGHDIPLDIFKKYCLLFINNFKK